MKEEEVLREMDAMRKSIVDMGIPRDEVDEFCNDLMNPDLPESNLKCASMAAPMAARGPSGGDEDIITLPTPVLLNPWMDALLNVYLLIAPVVLVAVNSARGIAAAANVTIGYSPLFGASVGKGGELEYGFVLTPQGRLGVMGSIKKVTGRLFNLQAKIRVTVLQGGVEDYGGRYLVKGHSDDSLVSYNLQTLSIPEAPSIYRGITAGAGLNVTNPLDLIKIFMKLPK